MHASGLTKTFCTTREAAELLGVSVSTIQNWVEAGLLRSWKTEGGHRRIQRTSVESLLMEAGDFKPRLGRLEGRPVTRKTPRRPRILVVDDEPAQLRLYEVHLTAWNMAPTVETASNAFEGLVKLGKFRPDILITDLRMPRLNGMDLVEAVRAMPEFRDLQIVVVSGLPTEEIHASLQAYEDVLHLPKPVPYAELEKIAAAHQASRPAAAA